MHTYGLWPDYNPKAGGDNGSESDLRKDIELEVAPDGKLDPTADHNRYYELNEDQEADLLENLSEHHEYVGSVYEPEQFIIIPTNNCSSYASDTVDDVVGEDVDADSWLGFETPKELGESIESLEEKTPSTAPKWRPKFMMEPMGKDNKPVIKNKKWNNIA